MAKPFVVNLPGLRDPFQPRGLRRFSTASSRATESRRMRARQIAAAWLCSPTCDIGRARRDPWPKPAKLGAIRWSGRRKRWRPARGCARTETPNGVLANTRAGAVGSRATPTRERGLSRHSLRSPEQCRSRFDRIASNVAIRRCRSPIRAATPPPDRAATCSLRGGSGRVRLRKLLPRCRLLPAQADNLRTAEG